MEEKPYNFIEKSVKWYEFESIGSEKTVLKRVIFSAYESNVFNLALLDVLDNGETSDITESKNKDLTTILATVISIIHDFFQQNPDCVVTFKGSEEKRQRLYRLVISREINQIKSNFVIAGLINGKVELFEPNKNYELFIIRKKYENNR
jgi:hypothetical protein